MNVLLILAGSLLVVVGSVGLWLLVCFIVSHLGGWSSLARIYRSEKPFDGQTWHGCSGFFKFFGSYRRTLTLGANSEGLYIAVLALFRLAHPPLYIPWSEVSAESGRSLVGPAIALHFARIPSVPLTMARSLATQLAQASNGGLVLPGDTGP